MGLPIRSGGRGKRIARSAPKKVRITALKERQRGPETFALPWSMLWRKKKDFLKAAQLRFPQNPNNIFHKHSRKEKNEKILLRISHSPLPIPPPFSSLSYGQKLTKYISLYLINIEHRELRCSDLSCQALPVEGIYRRVGNPFNIGLRFVALINNHSDVTRHCYNQKTLEAPQKG